MRAEPGRSFSFAVFVSRETEVQGVGCMACPCPRQALGMRCPPSARLQDPWIRLSQRGHEKGLDW